MQYKRVPIYFKWGSQQLSVYIIESNSRKPVRMNYISFENLQNLSYAII